jgi:hypothetical protein
LNQLQSSYLPLRNAVTIENAVKHAFSDNFWLIRFPIRELPAREWLSQTDLATIEATALTQTTPQIRLPQNQSMVFQRLILEQENAPRLIPVLCMLLPCGLNESSQ